MLLKSDYLKIKKLNDDDRIAIQHLMCQTNKDSRNGYEQLELKCYIMSVYFLLKFKVNILHATAL